MSQHQQRGIRLKRLAETTGIRYKTLLNWTLKGQLIGARKHPLTRQWWVYPPAKLVLSDGSAHPKARSVSVTIASELASPSPKLPPSYA